MSIEVTSYRKIRRNEYSKIDIYMISDDAL